MKKTVFVWLHGVVFLVSLLSVVAVSAKSVVIDGQAPDFELPSNQGKAIQLSDLRGDVVMINFWASWCAPCRQEMPLLEALYEKYKKIGFTILGVNIDIDINDANKILKVIPVSFPVAYDTKNAVSDLYELGAMPTTVMVDRQGNMRFLHKGYKPGFEDAYEQEIRKLLRE